MQETVSRVLAPTTLIEADPFNLLHDLGFNRLLQVEAIFGDALPEKSESRPQVHPLVGVAAMDHGRNQIRNQVQSCGLSRQDLSIPS